MFVFQIQASFEYNQTESRFELYSTTLNKRIDFSGVKVEVVASIVNQLTNGIFAQSTEQAIYVLSTDTGVAKADVQKIFKVLEDLGAIVRGISTPSSKVEDKPFDRQIRFFNSFENDLISGADYQKRLSQKSIVIVGLGGYGTWLSLFAMRMGIGTVIGVDFDVVDASNLDRQILYKMSDVGRLKVEAAAENLAGINKVSSFIPINKKIEKTQDLVPIIENVDLVLNPFSYYRKNVVQIYPGVSIAEACASVKVPLLSLGGNIVGPLTVNSSSACYMCAVEYLQQTMGIDHHKRNMKAAKRAFAPILANTCSIAAFEAACFLGGFRKPITINTLIQTDWFSNNSSKIISISQAKSCLNHGSRSNEQS